MEVYILANGTRIIGIIKFNTHSIHKARVQKSYQLRSQWKITGEN